MEQRSTFSRLTRADILNQPPDILITSPDMINRMLQVPGYHRKIFTSNISIVVLDEIHMYNSVFGCNVAHLLRRFEEACKHKPFYIGVSATIGNAKELACLIFDANLNQVKYLRPKGKNEGETEEKRPYLIIRKTSSLSLSLCTCPRQTSIRPKPKSDYLDPERGRCDRAFATRPTFS